MSFFYIPQKRLSQARNVQLKSCVYIYIYSEATVHGKSLNKLAAGFTDIRGKCAKTPVLCIPPEQQ